VIARAYFRKILLTTILQFHMIFSFKHRVGSIRLESGSTELDGAGEINLLTGKGSLHQSGGGINIIARTNAWSTSRFDKYDFDDVPKPTEINFGFDEISGDLTERQISLQLMKLKNSTRLASSVPLQVTVVQYTSDERIKQNISDVDTGELLDRMRLVELREYGYTDEWRRYRGLGESEIRVRGVVAQELKQIFPEHVQILDELVMKDGGPPFKDFHQVDKQGLVMDREFQLSMRAIIS
jgi:hypothetical protein